MDIQKKNKVCITGVSGSLGSYMAELLLSYGFEVVGTIYDPQAGDQNYRHMIKHPSFGLAYLDVLDAWEVEELIKKENPDYFFNFAGDAFVSNCWKDPTSTMEVNTLGVLNILEAIKKHIPECRFFNACSSEIFSGSGDYPQTEQTAPKPTSIYGVSKNSAREIIESYRNKYNLFAVSGIFYGQEGPKRSDIYVTRKITKGVARIKKALEKGEAFEPIKLGNLNSEKDWSFAKDGVECAWRMLNQEKYHLKGDFEDFNFHYQHDGQNPRNPKRELDWLSKNIKDYIISSGESHTVKEFVELAFQAANIEGTWVGEKLDAYYVLPNYLADFAEFASQKLVEVDPSLVREDKNSLLGDNSLIKKELNWQPKVSFRELVKIMVLADIEELQKSS